MLAVWVKYICVVYMHFRALACPYTLTLSADPVLPLRSPYAGTVLALCGPCADPVLALADPSGPCVDPALTLADPALTLAEPVLSLC